MSQFPGRRRWLPPGLISEKNVKLSLGVSVIASLVSTIAHGHIFTAFIFELYGDNASVGYMESISGITSLVTAIPVGYAVDKVSRTKLLKGSAVIGLLAAILGALATVLGPLMVREVDGVRQQPGRAFTIVFMISLGLWGAFFSTCTSASLALFADSIPRGPRRQDLYATKSTVTLLAIAVGPLFAFVGSTMQGNDWGLEHMAYALLPGFMLLPLLCFMLTRFEDVPPQLDELQVSLLRGKQNADLETGKSPRSQTPKVGSAAVPYLLLAAELITSIGAGMTVKFFMLWFKNEHHFSPAGLALLQTATPLAIAVAVQALQVVARVCPCGQVVAMLGFWLASIASLLAMARVTDWRALVVLHLLRASLANCKEPLARSILADFIPSNRRGRWNAAHSLTSMTWTGSAALGGVLCDRYGYGQTFLLTAGIYLFAAVFWLPLVYLVPQDRRPEKSKEAGGEDAGSERVKGA